ncbi:ABC transporter substrate-binding protein [Xylophilus sp.]|uniref:ABC transporter substrate-binding protein n=1 Tax=Xylophilus sp. TaxID=2653893 RepID=UPI0013BDE6E0|nr:ABC transporter substrate-binding protein [Xylophilus sp.]KAF1049184.1 MAG: putative aliphatic sulfonates-binding protein [Xylophilus sp.]
MTAERAGRRRIAAAVLVTLAVLATAGWAIVGRRTDPGAHATARLPLDAPLPTVIPPGTRLVVGDPTTQRVAHHLGWDKNLPFEIEWANISGGPAVTEAFQARALDIGSAANIPPIHAIWVGIPVKIIAWRQKREPLKYPGYVIGTSPGSGIRTLADLKGKKIAFSPGQAQGAVVLNTLKVAGLTTRDVQLVDLPATAGVYDNALASNLVDAAPLGRAALTTKRYVADYGKEGARLLEHGPFRDDAGILYVRTETLEDPAKAAAIREYVKLHARAADWTREHREEWNRIYYLQDQHVSLEDARWIIEHGGGAGETPKDWDDVIAYQQQTIDFMADQIGRERFDAATLFDRRFEKVPQEDAASTVAAASHDSLSHKTP